MCNTCGCNITPGNRPLVLAEKPKKRRDDDFCLTKFVIAK